MGIKELGSFLLKNSSDAIFDVKLGDFSSNTSQKCYAAIDTSLFMYKFKYSSGENFLIKFLELINRLKINNITPIFVFDGTPPTEKTDTITTRKEKKNEYKDQLNELNEKKKNLTDVNELNTIDEQIKKLSKKIIYVTKDNISQLKYMLNILNIPYIHENIEADLISSKLSSLGYVDMVISEDMDHLTNGTTNLIRDFNVNNNVAKCYNLSKIHSSLGLIHDKFIALCILFGCDYVKRIKGLGTISSFNIIKGIDDINIENIIKKIQTSKKLVVPNNYSDEFKSALKIFKNYELDVNSIVIYNAKIEENKLIVNELFDNQKENALVYFKKHTTLSERKITNRINNIFS